MCIGYNKLQPYGFPVHAAIDGYSQKILWLELPRSNEQPEIPARYYLNSVKRNTRCPILLRTDCGTEMVSWRAMQCYFRQDGIDEFSGEKAHKYGPWSPANQRIEGWWSFFRRGRAGWWIDLFKDMAESGVLDIDNTLHMECLWFLFVLSLHCKMSWTKLKITGIVTAFGLKEMQQFLVFQMYCTTYPNVWVVLNACILCRGNKLMKWSITSNMRILMNQVSTKNTFIMWWTVRNLYFLQMQLRHTSYFKS